MPEITTSTPTIRQEVSDCLDAAHRARNSLESIGLRPVGVTTDGATNKVPEPVGLGTLLGHLRQVLTDLEELSNSLSNRIGRL